MGTLAVIIISIVIVIHLYIVWMEMFAWETLGRKVFKGALPDDLFRPTIGLAANQGLYNGFLAAGLIWSFLITDPIWSDHVAVFFLGCIAVAGIYGAISASRKILFVQTLPALTGMLAILLKS